VIVPNPEDVVIHNDLVLSLELPPGKDNQNWSPNDVSGFLEVFRDEGYPLEPDYSRMRSVLPGSRSEMELEHLFRMLIKNDVIRVAKE
jgi:hypothetical protein